MCRLIGYLGPPVALDTLLYRPPFALARQTFAPRHQDMGRINADGWGVGWYDLSIQPEPARYRTATPMWADRRFFEMAPLIRSDLVVAAARNASPGAPVEETGNSPFLAGPYLFTHNGYVDGFRDGLGVQLRRGLSERREMGILGAADSEVIFAMILDRLDKGVPMGLALAEVIHDLRELTTGRFNFLLTDGQTMVATRYLNTLFTRTWAFAGPTEPEPRRHVIASEPYDDEPGWNPMPEHSLVTVSRGGGLIITPL